MNKDVIYIEPEDDITDIIKKIESSKEKIVALVPPKKTNVLRSIVNVKLIYKSGNKNNKKIVLVTSDPAILKLAAATKMPTTKNLQTAPTVPKLEDIEAEEESVEEIIKNAEMDDGEEVASEETADGTEEIEEGEDEDEGKVEDETEDDKEDEKTDGKKSDDKKGKGKKDKKKSAEEKDYNNPVIGWIMEHKKICIGGGIGLVFLILLLVWAFAIAPAVTVTIEIRTTTSNFSENVTFTENITEENAAEGKFYLEQKKMENKSEVEFEATGQKNVGEKAKGNVVVVAYFGQAGTVNIKAGTAFTLGDLAYTADEGAELNWDGVFSSCENDITNIFEINCKLSKRINVTAVEPGAQYNVEPSSAGWYTSAYVSVYSDQAMSGGTDKMVTIVQQSDIDNAITKLKTSDEKVNKERLFDEISDTSFVIESSFAQTTGDVISTPKLGEEAKDGKAKLSVTTTSTVYFIDKTKMEEFITEKAKLAENYKVYNINDPFIENFLKIDSGYTGKLKTSYVSGPEITENDVVEIVRGKGVGTAQHDLMDINGMKNITIKPSYPWVTSVPNDPEKITVFIDIPSEQEEQQ